MIFPRHNYSYTTQIAVGDNVKVDLVEMVTVIVSDKQVEPSRVDDVEMDRAALGEKPAGTITQTVNVMATVTDIDYEKRTVTLKGPLQTLVVEVDKEAYNFAKVKAGDTVNLKIVQKMAVAVTK